MVITNFWSIVLYDHWSTSAGSGSYHLSTFRQLFETKCNALSFVQSVKFSLQVLFRPWLLLEISWRVDCGVCAVCRWVPQWSPSTDRKPPLLLRQPFKTSHNWMFSKCMIFVSFSDVTTSTSQQVWKLGPNKKNQVFIPSFHMVTHQEANFCPYQFQLGLQSAENLCSHLISREQGTKIKTTFYPSEDLDT